MLQFCIYALTINIPKRKQVLLNIKKTCRFLDCLPMRTTLRFGAKLWECTNDPFLYIYSITALWWSNVQNKSLNITREEKKSSLIQWPNMAKPTQSILILCQTRRKSSRSEKCLDCSKDWRKIVSCSNRLGSLSDTNCFTTLFIKCLLALQQALRSWSAKQTCTKNCFTQHANVTCNQLW